MQSFYPEYFERVMGCTEAEWLRWLPAAVGEHPWHLAEGTAVVQLGRGAALTMNWYLQAPLLIGLVRMPRLWVDFRFTGLDEAARHDFMRRFDLYMQRGGG